MKVNNWNYHCPGCSAPLKVLWAYRKLPMRCFACRQDHLPPSPEEQPDAYLDDRSNAQEEWYKFCITPIDLMPKNEERRDQLMGKRWHYQCHRCCEWLEVPWQDRHNLCTCLKCKRTHLPPEPHEQPNAYIHDPSGILLVETPSIFCKAALKVHGHNCSKCRAQTSYVRPVQAAGLTRKLSAGMLEPRCENCRFSISSRYGGLLPV